LDSGFSSSDSDSSDSDATANTATAASGDECGGGSGNTQTAPFVDPGAFSALIARLPADADSLARINEGCRQRAFAGFSPKHLSELASHIQRATVSNGSSITAGSADIDERTLESTTQQGQTTARGTRKTGGSAGTLCSLQTSELLVQQLKSMAKVPHTTASAFSSSSRRRAHAGRSTRNQGQVKGGQSAQIFASDVADYKRKYGAVSKEEDGDEIEEDEAESATSKLVRRRRRRT
jgi:hypothetical protein